MPDLDSKALKTELHDKHGPRIRDIDVVSAALYPKVFDEYMQFRIAHSDISVLPTRICFAPMEVGEEAAVEIERGKTLIVQLNNVGQVDDEGIREVFFLLNGRMRTIRVRDAEASKEVVVRERADPGNPGSVGAPMPGLVIDVRTKVGVTVDAGDPLVVLSAMKMETVVASPVAGKVAKLVVAANDDVSAGDLLCVIEPVS